MRRVLIITYYWPPGGGAGVQRWLKFAKYLPHFGWQPVIYTPENPELPVIDESLLKDIPKEAEIVKQKIWEPYEWYKRFAGRKGEKINTGFLNEKGKGGMAEKIAVWLRGNLFIPDARKYWINPSVNFLNDYLKQHPVDAIISSGPPHSMHIIALKLKQRNNIKWIADFRDPWTNIDYYQDLMLTSYADKKHHQMEREVLAHADVVVAVGKTMAQEFKSISGKNIEVITNGYDDDDVNRSTVTLDSKFTIAHIGTLVKSRNPEQLWKVLSDLVTNSDFASDFKLVLTGKVDFNVKQSLDKNGLLQYTEFIEYLPHDEVIKVQQRSQVLLLILNNTQNAKGILTGKLFEYMSAKRPVLCIGATDGDAAEIVSSTETGITCNFDDGNKMKQSISHFYQLYKSGGLTINANGVERYSRKSLTEKLVEHLNYLVK